ncbi:Trehalose/maltose import ATP-binding protein MalK [Candidatus Gugararchaeum adminiculabundum]|nr:Trehalose/maltose import ATP-binding protein MalK [Candidatus Gugararchaeum adminiculabundum]
MEFALEAEGLTKVYQGKVVLYNFSLNIRKGEILGLLGPNGAGKSTFIRIISGLEEPDSGILKILGERAGKIGRRKIGVAPQENALYPLLTCTENLLYFGSLYGIGGKLARERAAQLLDNLGLEKKKNVPCQFLSGGMKRRLNLACALMHEPEIIILDEPTTGLDPATRVQMWKTVQEIVRKTGATLLLTTHYIEEAEALCSRIAFINSGQVVAEGTPNELKRRVGKELAKLTTIPGAPDKLIAIIKKINGIDAVTATEHGVVIEGNEISSKLPEISKALEKSGETIVELSLSRPSLEDVFLTMTGSKLREVVAVEPAKRN